MSHNILLSNYCTLSQSHVKVKPQTRYKLQGQYFRKWGQTTTQTIHYALRSYRLLGVKQLKTVPKFMQKPDLLSSRCSELGGWLVNETDGQHRLLTLACSWSRSWFLIKLIIYQRLHLVFRRGERTSCAALAASTLDRMEKWHHGVCWNDKTWGVCCKRCVDWTHPYIVWCARNVASYEMFSKPFPWISALMTCV